MIKNLLSKEYKEINMSLGFAAILTTIVFLPSSVAKFARLDDFSFYLYTREDVAGIIQSGWTYGRPITSFIIGNFFGRVNNINDFSLLRLLCLITLISVIFIIYGFYFRSIRASILVTVIATSYFISLPGIWVFMTWAQGFPHFIALLFVVISVRCYVEPKLKWLYFTFSLLSMFTYQPFSLLIPIILMSRLIKEESFNWIREYLRILFWNLSLLLFNYITVKLQSSPNPRSALLSDTQDKMQWIISEWIPRVFFPWSLNVNLPFATVSILVFAFFSLVYISKEGILKFGALYSTALFPAIPFLLSSENWASSRAVLSSNIAMSILIASLASSIQFKWRLNLSSKIIGSAFVSCLVALSIYQGYEGLVFPQAREWASVSKDINTGWGEISEIRANLAPFEQTSSPTISYDEFGILNSSVEGALLGMLTMAKFDTSLSKVDISVDTARICQVSKSYVDKQSRTLHLFPISGTEGCS